MPVRSRPLRIAFPFAGDLLGGSHVSSIDLIRHLDRDRFEPILLVDDDEGPVADFINGKGLAFERSPHRHPLRHWRARRHTGDLLIDLGKALSQVPKLAAFIRRRRIEIVHTNDGRNHLLWSLAATLTAARLLWHHRSDPSSKALRLIAPWTADRVVAVSRFAAPTWSTDDKVSVVPSPFPTEAAPPDRALWRERLLQETGAPASAFVVGYVGNLVPRKRPLGFVEAVAALRRQAPDLPLMAPMFGTPIGEAAAEVDALARTRGVGDAIKRMGFCENMDGWLAGCDALLVPSIGEPFGRTLIEAMLVGVPVVATRSGGNPEAITDGETGFLVPPDDPLAAASALSRLQDDPADAQRMAVSARAMAKARFGMRRHADAIMAIYDDLLPG